MKGINKVILVGRIGQKPELVKTNSGTFVTNFSIATSEKWKGGDGQQQEHTEWHRLTLFNKLAEIACDYCDKGDLIYVEGSTRTSKYQKEGVERENKQVIVNTMQILTPKGNKSDADNQQQYANSQPAHNQPPTDDDFESDIPF